MFCYQCQEALKNQGCTVKGFCGKKQEVANLQDLLVYVVKGISVVAEKAGTVDKEVGHYLAKSLFTTITNTSFDDDRIIDIIKQGLALRDELKNKYRIVLKDFHLVAEMRRQNGLLLSPGQNIRVVVKRSDPREDEITVECVEA